MRNLSLLPCVALAFLSLPCEAARDGDLWVGPVAMVCLANNAEQWNTPLGTALQKNSSIKDSVTEMTTGPLASCLTSREWVSEALCSELLSLDPSNNPPLEPIYSRHKDQISDLNKLFSCFTNAKEKGSGVLK